MECGGAPPLSREFKVNAKTIQARRASAWQACPNFVRRKSGGTFILRNEGPPHSTSALAVMQDIRRFKKNMRPISSRLQSNKMTEE